MRIQKLSIGWRGLAALLAMTAGLVLSCNGDGARTHDTRQADTVCCPDCNICGNGIVEFGEACDDGNTIAGDGCSPLCAIEQCGNGELDPGEECDDGNTIADDGCSPDCKIQSCGDGRVEGDEQCDDGNTDSGDGCSSGCRLEGCGDGELDPATEECDDGNRMPGDGCDSQCHVEGSPAGVCGDGKVDPGEECDDGNSDGGDSCVGCIAVVECSAATACVSGDHCCPTGCGAGEDADCVARCGNGVCEPGEDGTVVTHTASAFGTTVEACPQDCAVSSCAAVTACVNGDGCCPAGCAMDSDCLPTDSDGDGIIDTTEGAGDCDGDGIPDYLDADPCPIVGGGSGADPLPDAGVPGPGSGSSAPPVMDAGLPGPGSGAPPVMDAGTLPGSPRLPGPGSGISIGVR